MSAEPVLERLCNLPFAFYGGTKSPVQLVAESGLAECESALSVNSSTLGVLFKDIHARLLSL